MSLKVFEQQEIRSHWDENQEKWYFSVIDVVAVLTESQNPRRYWSDLKIKL
ncbi:phage antirepressor protein [Lonepinella sp. BR2930]